MSCVRVSRDEVEAQTTSLKDAVSGLFLACQQIQSGNVMPRSQAQETSQECMAVLVSQISATLDLCKKCGAPSTRQRQLQKEIEDIEAELKEKVGLPVRVHTCCRCHLDQVNSAVVVVHSDCYLEILTAPPGDELCKAQVRRHDCNTWLSWCRICCSRRPWVPCKTSVQSMGCSSIHMTQPASCPKNDWCICTTVSLEYGSRLEFNRCAGAWKLTGRQ